MLESNFKIINFEESLFDNLSLAYRKIFNRNIISKELYNNRFKYNGKYSSIVIYEESTYEIIAHIGFKIFNGSSKFCNRFACRYSTFVNPSLRGKGIYKELMDFAKVNLKENFAVDIIYAWPNRINLISCLKDESYINLPPIITWQKEMYVDNIENNRNIIKLEKDFLRSKNAFRSISNDSKEDLQKIFYTRENKDYFTINKKNQKGKFVIGRSKIDENNLISIVLDQEDYLEQYIQNENKVVNYKEKAILQAWCSESDIKKLRILLKYGFSPQGPTFFRGIYILSKENVKDCTCFPQMYHHDTF